jgi:hypothetical protein
VHGDSDAVFELYAEGKQMMSKLVGAGVELRVGEALVAKGYGDLVRMQRCALLEQGGDSELGYRVLQRAASSLRPQRTIGKHR